MAIRLRFAGAALIAAALGTGACGGGNDAPLVRVFGSPPWTGAETLRYQLRDREDIRGTCTLETAPAGEQTRLLTTCVSPDGQNRDDREVTVTAKDLSPLSSTRTISDAVKATKTTFTATYSGTNVTLNVDSNGGRNETTRDLPTPGPLSSDPGWYDDSALQWVVRGLPLREGFEGSFMNVNPGNARTVVATARVEGKERVRVPAGQFDTWRISVETNSVTQLFWIAAEKPNHIVKARIERDLWELLPDAR